MQFIAGIQARLGSSRLQNKVLFPLGDRTILQHVVDAAIDMDTDDYAVLTDRSSVDTIREHGISALSYGGPVSGRFNQYASETWMGENDYFVRLCGDQPFVRVDLANQLIERARETGADYVGYLVNGRPAALTAYGIYPEVVRVGALKDASLSDHVTNTIYMRPDKFRCEWEEHDPVVWDDEHAMAIYWYSLTIDTILDYYRIKKWYEIDGGWPADPMGDPDKNDGRYEWLK